MAGGVSIPIGADLRGLSQGIGKASDLLKDFKDSSKRSSEAARFFSTAIGEIGGSAGKAGGIVGNLLGSFATGGAMGLAIAGANALVGVIADLVHEASNAKTAFKGAMDSVAEFAKPTEEKLARLTMEARGFTDAMIEAVMTMRRAGTFKLPGGEEFKGSADDVVVEVGIRIEKLRLQIAQAKKDFGDMTERQTGVRMDAPDSEFEKQKQQIAELEAFRAEVETRVGGGARAVRRAEDAKKDKENAKKKEQIAAEHEAFMAQMKADALEGEQKIVAEGEAKIAAAKKKTADLSKEQLQDEIDAVNAATQEKIRAYQQEQIAKVFAVEKKNNDLILDRQRDELDALYAYEDEKSYLKQAAGDTQAAAELVRLDKQRDLVLAGARQTGQDELAIIKEFEAKKAQILGAAGREAARSYVEPMVEASAQALGGMLTQTQSFGQGVAGVMQTAYGLVMQTITKMVTAWILGENTKTAATGAGTAMRVAMELGAAVKSVAITFASGIKQIAIHAAKAAAAAYAAIASIPYVGPFLAPAAAGAALIAVLALGKGLASAEGGWETPSMGGPFPALLHTDEKVLNTRSSRAYDRVAEALDSGAGFGGGSNTYVIQALDARSFERFARDNPDAFVRVIRDLARNGRS